MAQVFKVGEAPWEQGNSALSQFKVGQAPWEVSPEPTTDNSFVPKINPSDWKTGNVEALGAKEAPPFMPEQTHPDVSAADRFVVKNFANSPQAGASYLNQKGFETEIKDGDIFVKRPNETKYLPIAPMNFDLQKVTDNAYNLPAGALAGAASAAGGLAGNLPGAVAAGGVAAGGLEALRQRIGQYAGIPQDISGKQVLTAGVVGGATPLLFGTGATGAQIAARALENGVPEEALAQGQKSLLTQMFPSLARISSGVPKEAVQTYMQRQPEVDALIQQGPNAAANVAEDTSQQIKKQFFDAKQKVGASLASNINGSPNLIETNKIFQPLQDRLDSLIASERANTPNGKAEIEAIKDQITGMKQGLPDQITPKTAWEIQDQMKHLANYNNVKGTFVSRYGNNATGAEKMLADAAGESYKITNGELNKAADTSGLKKQYSYLSDLQDSLQKYFKDPETTERTMMSLDAKSKGAARKTVEALDNTVGPSGVTDNAKLLQAYGYFQKPELLPMSTGGTTSTSRSLGLSGVFGGLGGILGEGGRDIGQSVGNVMGGPAAVKTAIQFGNAINPQLGAIPARVAPMAISPWLKMQLQKQNLQQEAP